MNRLEWFLSPNNVICLQRLLNKSSVAPPRHLVIEGKDSINVNVNIQPNDMSYKNTASKLVRSPWQGGSNLQGTLIS